MDGLGRGLMEIAMALLGVAFIAMLITNSGKTSQVVTTLGSTFSNLINAATLSNMNGLNVSGLGFR